MVHFAGPISLTTSEANILFVAFIALILIAVGIFALIVTSTFKAAKARSKTANNSQAGARSFRSILAIVLPILTVLAFVAWLQSSMDTQAARTSLGAFPLSTILGNITWGLLAASIITAVYNLIKK